MVLLNHELSQNHKLVSNSGGRKHFMAGQCLLLGTIISVTFFISVRFLLSTVLTEVPISFGQIWILTVACCSELLNCKIIFF